MEALSRVFGSERKEPLLLGSVKSNVGHSEAASGITSIIKATLMLENALIPPTHGLKKINSNIQTSEWNVRIVTQNEPWPQTPVGMPRRVSINSVRSTSVPASTQKILTVFVVRIWWCKCPCCIGAL